jgi:hypothetical protein
LIPLNPALRSFLLSITNFASQFILCAVSGRSSSLR